MNGRTREYLKGRFGDHYRRASLSPPPAANEREWGYITWGDGGTTMVRHHSYLDVTGGGDLGGFLAGERPRHVYFSAGRYDDPGASSMGQKGWRGSDLVFDLDADHLPGIDPSETSYAAMLEACKGALSRLLDLLVEDFGFEPLAVVFSGGRGYHVHVRRDDVLELDRTARREIVEYVLGEGLDFDDIVSTQAVAGSAGRSSPAQKRTLPDGGWAGRVRTRLTTLFDEVLTMEEAAALDRLREFDGIGEGKAKAALTAARNNREELTKGNVDVHPAVYSIARELFETVVEAESAPIDEPVTTDINRLIRLPGSLHGGTGLEVQHLDRDAIDAFDPLSDAVPETFVGNEIAIYTQEPTTVELRGESFRLSEGVSSVPEYVGVFAMARGYASKAGE
ncbi:DNA primase small subunit [Natronomonas pharaonis DSM 2160]|uniref:DNA primase small subunit PriS n=1 Tax=Natronomonas pharaonis (strain ATCC 35678 / DSM 2160 / CIP 103997 / JCM 8858 / NBRC 14720 / NCIMB 2260 / Gabara) TaxID=348780 RepID=PRIS_NATPD|nr:DNA primase small subunit PriS [Natronomonas pharaonis]Q3IP66.1 RecName: Full=DNA primase small subunit PriS [Natronomonas pharaonis DSM 2160]CAI50086.1 DNA primase small subunit [Natronomonas pharaonis DSM 2160]